MWLAKDNRLLNPKSSYERILTAPPCRLISCLQPHHQILSPLQVLVLWDLIFFHQHLLQLALDNTFQVFWEGLWLYFHGKTFLRITNNNSLFFILKSKIIILKHNNILIKPFLCFLFFFFLHLCCYCYLPLMGLVFWNSIHLEVASDSFCFLINSSWLLVFILFMICWKGIYFSYNLLHIGLIFSFHYWFRDLLREFDKKYEVLLIIFFYAFS